MTWERSRLPLHNVCISPSVEFVEFRGMGIPGAWSNRCEPLQRLMSLYFDRAPLCLETTAPLVLLTTPRRLPGPLPTEIGQVE